MTHVEKLKHSLSAGNGVRIGHTSVVSRKVHSTSPINPEVVNIITNTDAGRIFYHRYNLDEVIHIDLFHEVSIIDVKSMAKDLILALSESKFHDILSYIDVMTSGGGGSITGNLNYATENLINNHLNHVHIAALISDEKLDSVFLLVEKVEESLMRQGIELRKVEKIVNCIGNSPVDLSPYCSDSDSRLRQNCTDDKYQNLHEEAISMIERYESLEGICDVLSEIDKGEIVQGSINELEIKRRICDYDEIVKQLKERHFIQYKHNKYSLTPRVKLLRDYMRNKYKEFQLVLKKLLNKQTQNAKSCHKITYLKTRPKSSILSHKTISRSYCTEDGLEELDVSSTLKNSLARSHFENTDFYVDDKDLVTIKKRKATAQDICLLIDSSASMAGKRIKNAKYLAKHLVLKYGRRISVLAFQDKEVKIKVPFTKNFSIVDKGLNEITSEGLTPLALALHQGISYTTSNHIRNPLIILITDGIPTVSLWSSDPIEDAIKAAKNIYKIGCDFCCIGLAPNKTCLMKITTAAKGKLFILDELDRDSLINITKKSGQLHC
jgi:magnesium chelatase subunit D